MFGDDEGIFGRGGRWWIRVRKEGRVCKWIALGALWV